MDTCDELAWVLVENPPMTAAGAAALLDYDLDAFKTEYDDMVPMN